MVASCLLFAFKKMETPKVRLGNGLHGRGKVLFHGWNYLPVAIKKHFSSMYNFFLVVLKGPYIIMPCSWLPRGMHKLG
jgi:hypothetical protein